LNFQNAIKYSQIERKERAIKTQIFFLTSRQLNVQKTYLYTTILKTSWVKKDLLLLIIIAFISNYSWAQIYNINAYNGQTISSCSGNFFDPGGSGGAYVGNQTYTVTFAPGTAGTVSNITFTSFSVGIGDALEVYDGATVAAPLMNIYNNGNSPVGQTIRPSFFNVGGKLTFKWTSVGTGIGWAAMVHCGFPCQNFSTILTNSTPPFVIENGRYIIDICPGDSVSLHAASSFPLNDIYYHQDTATTNYTWSFGGATSINGQNINAVFNNIQGYNAAITAFDSNGCRANQTTEVRIRVSTTPTFNGTDALDDTICQNTAVNLFGAVQPTSWSVVPSLSVAGLTYLPDGSGVSYTTSVVFTGFGAGQTIQNASNILKVFAEMEHSYLGDLNITLKCPNNSTVTLKSYPGGTGTFLGEPIDQGIQVAGLGYMYHWTSVGSTTMLAAAGSYSHNFTDILGTPYASASYLPPSAPYPATSTASAPYPIIQYLPETPFSNFIGCPLNGTWTITVTDNLMADNGYIFQWGIAFDPAILPVAWGYTPVIDSSFWNISPLDTVQQIITTPGLQTLTYTMIDGAGCIYDTSLQIFVNPVPTVNLGNDTSICIYNNLNIQSGNTVSGTNYQWSNGQTTASIQVNPQITTQYSLTATSPEGCINYDTLDVIVNSLPQITLTEDTLICIGTTANLHASGGNQYLWSNGQTGASIVVSPNVSQVFSVTVTDQNQCVNDSSMQVIVAPLPQIITSNDTTVCEGTEALIKAKGGNIYQWSNGVNSEQQTVYPTQDETYKVTVTNLNQCVDSAVVKVYLLENPTPNIYADYDTICKGGTVSLVAQGAMKYLWDNGLPNSSVSDAPIVSKTYHVTAINEKNGTQCYDTTSYFVFVEHCALYIPSAFTPNGDGLNDLFGPKGIVSDHANYQFIILDQWGKIIFTTNDRFEQWDGLISGVKAMQGVYTYYIQVSEKSIQPYEIKGTVTLIR
jgi:gliding motility-associated-like protein